MPVYNLSSIKAFPSAVGMGKNTTGGRGQSVYKVTTLSGSSTAQGSIRDAVSGSNRIIVFTVAGTINLFEAGTNGHLYVYGSNITIAGETAPGDGICIYGHVMDFRGNNIICRHIRVRSGDPQAGTGRQCVRVSSQTVTNQSNLIFDHCSFSWGDDETFSLASQPSNESLANVTVQNSIISENFGTNKQVLLWGTNITNISFIRNYLAHTYERNIRCSTSSVTWEMQDNYIFHYGGALDGTYGNKIIAVGNVWETNLTPYQQTLYIQACSAANCPPSGITDPAGTEIFYNDNLYNGGAVTTNSTVTTYKVTTKPFDSGYTSIGSTSVKTSVLNNTGARRGINNGLDTLDSRIVNDAINNTNISSFPSTEAQAGGLPTLASGTYPTDTLITGIPDTFTTTHSISSANQVKSTWTIDGNTINNTAGYTAIEIYLFSLTGDLTLTENQITVPVYTHNTLKAFPSAVGHGRNTSGGRGKPIYTVTSLADSGAGTLRQAISNCTGTNGGTIVFKIAGVIDIVQTIWVTANTTIAGETAPGDGITIVGKRLEAWKSNIIIRHIRHRGLMSSNADNDAFRVNGDGSIISNVILDHCSASHGVDENIGFQDCNNVTIQNVISANNRGSGAWLLGTAATNVSFYNNLSTFDFIRLPRVGEEGRTEYINNYHYGQAYFSNISWGAHADLIGNVWEYETDGNGSPNISDQNDGEPLANTLVYLVDNLRDGGAAATITSNLVSRQQGSRVLPSDIIPSAATTTKSKVLNNAGARKNISGLDSYDTNLINQINTSSGTYDSAPYTIPTHNAGIPITDTIIPGIPNTFVSAHGITSANQVITNWDFGTYQVVNNAGYTALEIYLFSLTGDLTAGTLSEGSSPAQIGKTLKSLRFGGSKGKKFYQGNTILKRAKLG